MAVLKSIASGNFTDASTWGLIDSTSYLNGENATESLLTTAYSATRSQSFTPGAITVSHIGVKLCERIGTTGTMSVHLATSADHVEVAGTEVTINVADLPSALEADLNGGWIFFKLASPVTLAAATGYEVEAKTSSATQVDLFCDATLDNISRALVTTTTQAPATGDDFNVSGEFTGAGTSNSFTVTMNNTATTDFGAADTALPRPAMMICTKGTLTWGTAAATAYYLKLSGHVIIYSGGTMNMGTTGTPCPRDSSMHLQFDCGANVDFGLTVRNLGTFTAQGLSRTSGKNIVKCLLNTDEAVNSTSLGVDTDTGWLDNDEIAVATTTRTATQCEKGALNGAAGASSLTVDGFAGVGGGLAFAHSGTSPTQAEVVLLTRNVKISGASATLQSFIDIRPTSTVDCDWAEFYWLGSATALKRGIDIATTTGSCSFNFCSRHSSTVASSMGFNVSTASGTITLTNSIVYNVISNHWLEVATSGAGHVITDCVFMTCNLNGSMVTVVNIDGSFNNNAIIGNQSAGANAVGFTISDAQAIGFNSNYHDINIHGHACDIAMTCSVIGGGTISNLKIWRNLIGGVNSGALNVTSNLVTYDNCQFFGNQNANLLMQSPGRNNTFLSCTSNGDTTFGTLYMASLATAVPDTKFINCSIGVVSGIFTAHTVMFNILSTVTYIDILVSNCPTSQSFTNDLVNSQSNFPPGKSAIRIQKFNQIAGRHRTYKAYGYLATEDTIVRTGGKSLAMIAVDGFVTKLESSSFLVPVANGATLTPSVYVRESTSPAYAGGRPRLVLKRNDAIGITADVVIATATAASEGAWEQLTGTTAAATDNGVMEFVVDCDNSIGAEAPVYVDDFTCS